MLKFKLKDGKELSMATERDNIKMLGRVEELNRLLEDKEFKIVASNNFKNNGGKVGYALTSKVGNAAPVVYYDDIAPFWESNQDIIEFLENVFQKYKIGYVNLEKCCTREYIVSHVKPRLVSSDNLKMVQEHGIVYEEFLDMLILYYFEIEEMSDDEGMASATLKYGMLEQAGITLQELKEYADTNLKEDYRIVSLEYIISRALGEDWNGEDIEDEMPMWVVTNRKGMQGAATILSKEILTEVSKNFDSGTFAIIPSSVHECIVVSAGKIDEEVLRRMVYEVNRTELQADDILTDSVYLYKNGKVTIY